jgi:hypothetical protein
VLEGSQLSTIHWTKTNKKSKKENSHLFFKVKTNIYKTKNHYLLNFVFSLPCAIARNEAFIPLPFSPLIEAIFVDSILNMIKISHRCVRARTGGQRIFIFLPLKVRMLVG